MRRRHAKVKISWLPGVEVTPEQQAQAEERLATALEKKRRRHLAAKKAARTRRRNKRLSLAEVLQPGRRIW